MYGDTMIYHCPVYDATRGGMCDEAGTRGELREHLTRDHRQDAEDAESLAYGLLLGAS